MRPLFILSNLTDTCLSGKAISEDGSSPSVDGTETKILFFR
ncbi:MAG: hypothetical protein [Olavius algarvensis Delta 4 endosymbiont]|nr:MAG: hypothetical protein [Olavius algarvensis Delta 4 endosymbiont]